LYPQIHTEGIILKKRAYLEKDLWIEVYTQSYGRICCLIKNAKDLKNNFHGKIELFSLIDLLIEKREKYIIKNICVKKYFSCFDNNIENLAFAGGIAETTLNIIPENYNPKNYFELLKTSIGILSINNKGLAIFFIFQIKALFLLGYINTHTQCQICNNNFLESDLFVYIDQQENSINCVRCSGNHNLIKIKKHSLNVFNYFIFFPFNDCLNLIISDLKTYQELLIIMQNLNHLSLAKLKSIKFWKDLYNYQPLDS